MPSKGRKAAAEARQIREADRWVRVALLARSLLIIDDVLGQAPFSHLLATIDALTGGQPQAQVGPAYAHLYRTLATTGEGLSATARSAVVASDSLLLAVRGAASSAPPQATAIWAGIRHDLRVLAHLIASGERLHTTVALALELPSLPILPPSSAATTGREPDLDLIGGPDGPTILRDYYDANGGGFFGRARTWTWVGRALVDHSPLEGFTAVPNPDPIRAADLLGSLDARVQLRRNTANLLRGRPANNVLLYGDRGTGKSSSVKSLVHEPDPAAWPGGTTAAGDGEVPWGLLRIIDVPKSRLIDFATIVTCLRDRPERFILFVDDLSFEEGETQYKDLKALLDGGLAVRPPNVVVYATSNRRHLVREQFSDRPDPLNTDVHRQDTVQEKISFADRFGLTLTFTTPSQEEYLAIAAHLASRRGLAIPSGELRRRAIAWAAWHNGRSGRTARQFVDDLEADA